VSGEKSERIRLAIQEEERKSVADLGSGEAQADREAFLVDRALPGAHGLIDKVRIVLAAFADGRPDRLIGQIACFPCTRRCCCCCCCC
jgi:hypothetical protein